MHLVLLLLSLLGLLNASFLRYQYNMQVRFGKKSFCLIGSDCFEVTGSKYGRTLGLKNEDLGIGYYLLVASLVGYYLLRPNDSEAIKYIIPVATLTALVFSLFLLFAQSLILKKYCFLCLLSIGINLSLFVVSWFLLG